MINIHIFYRHYNTKSFLNPSRPEWFSYESCFTNMLETIKGKDNIKFNLVIDGEIGDNWVKKFNLPYIQVHGGGDWKSFSLLLNIVKNDPNIKQHDLIYFCENDYLHSPNWSEYVVDLYSTFDGLEYVSLYDHNDKYFLKNYEDLTSKIFTTRTRHWRTTPSTCGTFICSKEILLMDYDIMSTMEGDHNKWIWLNQNRGRSIITPIPGLSTHCMEGLLSPTIDWKNILLQK